jgi:hypothetical protein
VFSTAGARQVLAQLQATAEGVLAWAPKPSSQADLLTQTPRPGMLVRPLRRIELPALMRLYDQTLARRFGSPLRAEAYWEWLINRRACDRIYVALVAPEPSATPELLQSIQGCVFVSEGRIVELLTESGSSDVAERLVARVCADASEQDQWQVRLDAPPDDPLHDLFQAAGGRTHLAEEIGGEAYMAKLFDPASLLAQMERLLTARLRQAGIARPVQLGLDMQVQRIGLVFTHRGMKVRTDEMIRPTLALRPRDLAPLVLGHWNVGEAIETGRIRASGKSAEKIAKALFPKLPWWRPPLDDLLA